MPLLLSIESAIRGGGVCLQDGGKVLASVHGEGGVSRAEDLLANIDAVLVAADRAVSSIEHIAVSTGPGSFTGIRIGVATALGLKAASGCEVVGISLLEAIAAAVGEAGKVIAALEVRKDEAAWQLFGGGPTPAAISIPQGGGHSDLAAFVESHANVPLVLDKYLQTTLAQHKIPRTAGRIEVVGTAFAELIADATAKGIGGSPEPLYLRAGSGGGGF